MQSHIASERWSRYVSLSLTTAMVLAIVLQPSDSSPSAASEALCSLKTHLLEPAVFQDGGGFVDDSICSLG